MTKKQHQIGDGINTCLACGISIQSRGGGSRGLCQNHYKRFRAQFKQLPAETAAILEETAIEMGILLAERTQGRPRVTDDPFKAIVDRLELKMNDDAFDEHVQKTVAKETAKFTAKPKANKNTKQKGG